MNRSRQLIRLLGGLLALLMPLGVLAGCGKKGNDPQTPTTGAGPETSGPYDENGYINDALPALNYGGEKLKILTWNPEYDDLCFTEEDGHGLIEDALFSQHTRVEKRLGIDIQITRSNGRQEDMDDYLALITQSNQSGDPFDVIGAYSGIGAAAAVRGLYRDLNRLPYIDFEKPWWPDDLQESIAVGGKLYFGSGDISPNLIYGLFAIVVNLNMVESHFHDRELIYDLVENNEWTLDRMIALSGEIYEDLNNPGEVDESDAFGFVFCNNVSMDAFLQGSGISITTKNRNGELAISSTLYSQQCDAVVSKLATFLKSDSAFVPAKYFGIFPEGRAMLTSAKISVCVDRLKTAAFDYGVVPIPKYSSGQKSYITTMNHHFSAYSVPVVLSDDMAGRSAAFMEAMGSEGYRSVTPAIFETAFKRKYSESPAVAAMFQLIRDGVRFDMGRLYRLNFGGDPPDTMFRHAIQQDQKWLTYISSRRGQWDRILGRISASLS